MNVIFLANAPWAVESYRSITNNPKVNLSRLCRSLDDLQDLDLSNYDILLSAGWSKKISSEVLSRIECIGVHCAELDRYSYGTPIQLQVIDGIKFTKHRVFKISYSDESQRAHAHLRLWSHEVDLDLTGGMDEILEQMTATSKVLFNMYLYDYPNITWKEWPEEELVRPKRNPEDSKLRKADLQKMSTKELYDFFRCLEAPYPNGYIEDEHGKLFIRKVDFKAK